VRRTIKTKRRLWRVLGLCVAVCGALGLVVYGVARVAATSEPLAALPPELAAAAALEQSFQNLPEEVPAPHALKIPIFIYHSVRPANPKDSDTQKSYEITPELFEQQLKYLQDHGYTTISLDQVAADLKAGTTQPVEKPVVLTFDDGWHNQYKYAFPLLKKYHMMATFYVYTNPIGTKHFLTWDELREMRAAGMTIEDHSLSHPIFKGMTLDAVRAEVTDSKKILEQELGTPVVHFASPYGYSSPEIMKIVGAAGYETYRTTYKGVYQDDPLRLRGTLVTSSLDYFIRELTR
jgi:peptidoglycan/xylan/chitin deacetylase (PgdA/CDA1 family)